MRQCLKWHIAIKRGIGLRLVVKDRELRCSSSPQRSNLAFVNALETRQILRNINGTPATKTIFALAVVVLLLIVLATLAVPNEVAHADGQDPNERLVSVPNLINLDLATAKRELDDAGLSAALSKDSSNKATAKVTAVYPKVGQSVPTGSVVILYTDNAPVPADPASGAASASSSGSSSGTTSAGSNTSDKQSSALSSTSSSSDGVSSTAADPTNAASSSNTSTPSSSHSATSSSESELQAFKHETAEPETAFGDGFTYPRIDLSNANFDDAIDSDGLTDILAEKDADPDQGINPFAILFLALCCAAILSGGLTAASRIHRQNKREYEIASQDALMGPHAGQSSSIAMDSEASAASVNALYMATNLPKQEMDLSLPSKESRSQSRPLRWWKSASRKVALAACKVAGIHDPNAMSAPVKPDATTVNPVNMQDVHDVASNVSAGYYLPSKVERFGQKLSQWGYMDKHDSSLLDEKDLTDGDTIDEKTQV